MREPVGENARSVPGQIPRDDPTLGAERPRLAAHIAWLAPNPCVNSIGARGLGGPWTV